MRTNVLYYGDNLEVMREYFPDDSVDIVYLDPPFNSKRSYNVLYRESTGAASEAQVEAFEDSWRWGEPAAAAYHQVMIGANSEVARILGAIVEGLRRSDIAAYLSMMTPRLIELHRVMRETSSLYLHCDPTSSHYLKLLLDSIFGASNFLNEITWERFNFHSDARRWGRIHDVMLVYAKNVGRHRFRPIRKGYDPEYIRTHFKRDKDGRLYRLDNALAEGQGPARRFFGEFIQPRKGTHWRWSQERIDKMCADGKIVLTSRGKPAVVRYLDEMMGHTIGDVWSDIPEINSQAKERLGYNTQKPLKLLERILMASSDEGDVVLDPFCGCGTAVHAAQKLSRRWIGIDITYLAINLIDRRLRDAFPGMEVDVIREPTDLAGASDLAKRDRYQFQWWALAKVNGQPVGGKRKKGPDRGVDGVIPVFLGPEEGYRNVIVSVKSGENVSVDDIHKLISVVELEKSIFGLLVTLTPPTKKMNAATIEYGTYGSDFWGREFKKIQIITIQEIFAGRKPELPWGKSPFAKAPIERGDEGKGNGRLFEQFP